MSSPEKTIFVSAPGSTMLLGEHAVLHDYPAVVCAVNKRLTVELTPRNDREINIFTECLGEYHTLLDELRVGPPFSFVLAAIDAWRDQLVYGFDISVQSEFSSQVGLGSSAAVTVATLGAISQHVQDEIDLSQICKMGVQVIRRVQGLGSGADVAASTYGGVVKYDPVMVSAERLTDSLPICLIYVGYKTSTVDVIQQVRGRELMQPKVYERLYQDMGQYTDMGVRALRCRSYPMLGEVVKKSYELQKKLGVSDQTIEQVIEVLSDEVTVFGAKISGSGLGDCVVALGDVPSALFQQGRVRRIDVEVEGEGVRIEQ